MISSELKFRSFISEVFKGHILLGIFSGKRYFNDILWIQEYDDNTLLLAAIRYKKTRSTTMES
jgi:hypothetical protein